MNLTPEEWVEAGEVEDLFSKVCLHAVRNMFAQYSKGQAAAVGWSPKFPTEVFCMTTMHIQSVVIPNGAVVTGVTGVKGCFWCRSSSQGQLSNLVAAVKMFMFYACVFHIV